MWQPTGNFQSKLISPAWNIGTDVCWIFCRYQHFFLKPLLADSDDVLLFLWCVPGYSSIYKLLTHLASGTLTCGCSEEYLKTGNYLGLVEKKEMINLVYLCPKRRWDKEPMMKGRNKGVKMCLWELRALGRTLCTCLWHKASLTVSCLQPAECRCPCRRGSRWKCTACVWSPSVSLRISHESTGSAAAPRPESWNSTPGWSVLCFLFMCRWDASCACTVLFFYLKPLHPGVGILQLQDGVEDDVGVSLGGDVLQGLQHAHHLGKNTKWSNTHADTWKVTTWHCKLSPRNSHGLLCDMRAFVAVAVLFDIKLLFFSTFFFHCALF